LSEPYPVTTTVQVVWLYHPDLLVGITALAEIPLSRFKPHPASSYRHLDCRCHPSSA